MLQFLDKKFKFFFLFFLFILLSTVNNTKLVNSTSSLSKIKVIEVLGLKEELNEKIKSKVSYLKNKNIYKDIWQAFVVLLPVKSVGVMGDERSYSYAVSIRAVTSVDGMTADFYMFKKNDLTEISKQIINEIKEVNRVLYDFTSKPPGTIEWE